MTTVHLLFVDADCFGIAAQDLDRVRRDILRAAQAGGGFVALPTGSGDCIEILVHAGTSVRWEHRQIEEPSIDDVSHAEAQLRQVLWLLESG